MPLVTSQGYNLSPQLGQGIGQGLKTLSQAQALGAQSQMLDRDAQIRALLAQQAPQTEQQKMLTAQTAGMGGEQALAEQPKPLMSIEEMTAAARRIDPEIANKQLKALGLDEPTRLAEASRFAAKLQSVPFEKRGEAITARAEQLQSEGRNPKDTLELLNMNQAQQDQALTGVQLMDLATKERFAAQAAGVKAAGLGGEVKSSKILDDGTNIQIMKDGNTRVVNPSGIELQGAEREKAIRDAQEFGVDVQQRRSKGRETGKGTGKIALKAFERVGQIKENIADLQKGVDLIEKEGATTGFIQDFLPNMKASTRKLANLRRQLGLNVVGSVTFGALSKGELDLAMDVALPKGISPEETVKWIKKRQDAQQKLADNLEDAALYLSDHSVADLIRRNKAMEKSADKKEKTQAVKQPPAGGVKFLGFES